MELSANFSKQELYDAVRRSVFEMTKDTSIYPSDSPMQPEYEKIERLKTLMDFLKIAIESGDPNVLDVKIFATFPDSTN